MVIPLCSLAIPPRRRGCLVGNLIFQASISKSPTRGAGFALRVSNELSLDPLNYSCAAHGLSVPLGPTRLVEMTSRRVKLLIAPPVPTDPLVAGNRARVAALFTALVGLGHGATFAYAPMKLRAMRKCERAWAIVCTCSKRRHHGFQNFLAGCRERLGVPSV
jgi:hypothetical protein